MKRKKRNDLIFPRNAAAVGRRLPGGAACMHDSVPRPCLTSQTSKIYLISGKKEMRGGAVSGGDILYR